MTSPEHTRIEFIDNKSTPSWFRYPEPFLRTVETGLVQFRPWKILTAEFCMSRMAGLKDRFPGLELVPFALRTDCDDVACWERGKLDQVVIIHDFVDPGWERGTVFQTFWDWLRAAVEDFIAFEPE